MSERTAGNTGANDDNVVIERRRRHASGVGSNQWSADFLGGLERIGQRSLCRERVLGVISRLNLKWYDRVVCPQKVPMGT